MLGRDLKILVVPRHVHRRAVAVKSVLAQEDCLDPDFAAMLVLNWEFVIPRRSLFPVKFEF